MRPLLASLALLSLTQPVLGVTPPSNDGATQSSAAKADGAVELFVVGDADVFSSVRTTVAPHALASISLRWARLDRFDASTLLKKPTQASSDVVIRCYLDLRDSAHARLYFVDRAGERFLIRELSLSGRLDELDRESLGQTVELSIRALVDDQRAGLTRAEAETLLSEQAPAAPAATPPAPVEAPPPAPPPAPAQRHGFAADAFWAAEAYSSAIMLMHGPGLALGYRAETPQRARSVWLSGQYELEQSYREQYVGVDLRAVALRVGADAWFRVGSSALLGGVRLSAGVDLVHFAPQAGSAEANVTLSDARSATSFLTSAGVLGAVELGARLRLSFGLLANLDLSPVHFDVQVDGRTSRVVDPFRVRPSALLALSLR
ncbi:MAG: hypothetical protein QM756_19050 [Polyangiaceae bacterium]